jgi:hypothetical protein
MGVDAIHIADFKAEKTSTALFRVKARVKPTGGLASKLL